MTPDTPLPDRDGNGSSQSCPSALPSERPEAPLSGGRGEPVAWRVKDYADGWIIYQQESAAASYRAETGALIEPLYTRSLSEAPRSAGWRDISSAPRDGTLMLLGRHDGDFPLVGVSWGGDFECARDESPFRPQPTHWQPLPPPPAEIGDSVAVATATCAGNPATDEQSSSLLSRAQAAEARLGEAVDIIAALSKDLRSPFPREALVVASLGHGDSSLERADAFLSSLQQREQADG